MPDKLERKLIIPSEKQAVDILALLENKYSLLQGAVRTGKTVAILIALPLLVRQHFNGEIMMSSKSLKTFELNILNPLREMYGPKYISKIKDKKQFRAFGKEIRVICYNDNYSFEKIQGSTISLAIVDEVVLSQESFFNMLLTRLSLPDSQLIMTCNPGNPGHFIKRWMDSGIEKYMSHYVLDDNPFISEDYKQTMIKTFEKNKAFYNRNILGLWVATDGLAYYGFDLDIHMFTSEEFKKQDLRNNTMSLVIGLDPANTQDSTSGVSIFVDTQNECLIHKRFLHNPQNSKALSNSEQIVLFKEYLKDLQHDTNYKNLFYRDFRGNTYPMEKVIVVDCAASDFILQLKNDSDLIREGWNVVKFTKKSIRKTLDNCNNAFVNNRIRILEGNDFDYYLKNPTGTDRLIEELTSVTITETDKGEVKFDDSQPNDCSDACRYGLSYIYRTESFDSEEN